MFIETRPRDERGHLWEIWKRYPRLCLRYIHISEATPTTLTISPTATAQQPNPEGTSNKEAVSKSSGS